MTSSMVDGKGGRRKREEEQGQAGVVSKSQRNPASTKQKQPGPVCYSSTAGPALLLGPPDGAGRRTNRGSREGRGIDDAIKRRPMRARPSGWWSATAGWRMDGWGRGDKRNAISLVGPSMRVVHRHPPANEMGQACVVFLGAAGAGAESWASRESRAAFPVPGTLKRVPCSSDRCFPCYISVSQRTLAVAASKPSLRRIPFLKSPIAPPPQARLSSAVSSHGSSVLRPNSQLNGPE